YSNQYYEAKQHNAILFRDAHSRSIIMDSLDQQRFAQSLTRKFPKIIRLTIGHMECAPLLKSMLIIITNWPLLNSLKIDILSSSKKPSVEAWNQLLISIVSLKSL